MNPPTITVELEYRNQTYDVMVPMAVTTNTFKRLT